MLCTLLSKKPKNQPSKAEAGMKSSGFCHSAQITGLEDEIRGFAGSGVYLFFCVYLLHSFLKGKNHVLLLEGYTTEINLEDSVALAKSTKHMFAEYSPWILYTLRSPVICILLFRIVRSLSLFNTTCFEISGWLCTWLS